jgi:hypothetical protein
MDAPKMLGIYKLNPKIKKEQENLTWGVWSFNWFDRPIIILKKQKASWKVVSFVRDQNSGEYEWRFTNALFKY